MANELSIARAFGRTGELVRYARGTPLIQQDASDNDLFLILHGTVEIRVNDRPVALRQAGTHVGEMALVDQLATRSATAVATTPTVALRIPEHRFSPIAAAHPDLWRRIAVEIANRLRQRNRFLTQPHAEPMLFIGSSTEGRDVANTIHSLTVHRRVVPRPWSDGVFQASATAIESLVALAAEADFAALVLTADDVTISRGRKSPSPRDNVTFELGLLIGALGRERVFLLRPRGVDIRIPTDLLGVTWLEYRKAGPGRLTDKLRAPCRAMLKRIP